MQTLRATGNPCIIFDSPHIKVSLGIWRGLVPGPPADTEIHRHSSPLYKKALFNAGSRLPHPRTLNYRSKPVQELNEKNPRIIGPA